MSKNNSYAKIQIKKALFILAKKTRIKTITITTLVNEACISRTTFYRNYSNIQEVIDDILMDIFNKDFKESVTHHDFKKCIYDLFKICKQNNDFFYILYKNNLISLIIKDILNMIKIIVKDKYSEYELTAIVYGLYAYIIVYLKKKEMKPCDDIVSLFCKQFNIE